MRAASQEFADDPCSSMKRGAMVRAARGLLSSVTRLLILADMVDIHLLLKSLHVVSSLSTSRHFPLSISPILSLSLSPPPPLSLSLSLSLSVILFY